MLKKQQKKVKRLRYLCEKHRDLIDNRIKEIFNFKQRLNTKITNAKENSKNMKYVNFNDETY